MSWYLIGAGVLVVSTIVGVLVGKILAWVGRGDDEWTT